MRTASNRIESQNEHNAIENQGEQRKLMSSHSAMEDTFEVWTQQAAKDTPCIAKWASTLKELGASWDTFRREPNLIIEDLVESGIPRLAARDICSVVCAAVKQSSAPMAVFWDLENMPIPTNTSGREIVGRIKSVLATHGDLTQFRAYASIGLNHIPQEKRSELQLSGCHLVDCPHNGRKEVADKMIIVDAMQFAYTHPDGATLCFITADVDYAYLLAVLQRQPQWRTIVISKGNIESMLHFNCNVKMRWETDVLQLSIPSLHEGEKKSLHQNTTPPNKKVETHSGSGRQVSSSSPTSVLPSPSPTAATSSSSGQRSESNSFYKRKGDFEVLRTAIRENPASQDGNTAFKSKVAVALHNEYPSRFTSRIITKQFLQEAVNNHLVVETGDGGFRAWTLSDTVQAGRFVFPIVNRVPLSHHLIPSRVFDIARTHPFVLFVPRHHLPRERLQIQGVYIVGTPSYLIFMFSKHSDVSRQVTEMPFLQYGTLVDWREAGVKLHPTVSAKGVPAPQTPVAQLIRCAACGIRMQRTDAMTQMDSAHSICVACYRFDEEEKTRAVEGVTALLETMAEHDDVAVPLGIVRKQLVEHPLLHCTSKGQARLWIDYALLTGAIKSVPAIKKGQPRVCLPQHLVEALEEFPPDDLDTTEEEAFVVQLLVAADRGYLPRSSIVAQLAATFPRMKTPAWRSSVIRNGRKNEKFFVGRSALGQVVALTKAKAVGALEWEYLTTDGDDSRSEHGAERSDSEYDSQSYDSGSPSLELNTEGDQYE